MNQMLSDRRVTDSLGSWALAALRGLLPSAGPGAIGGLISSVCCLLPAAIMATGLSGGLAATAVSLGQFRLYGIAVGLAFVLVVSWLSVRRSRSCCTEEEYKRRRTAVPLTMLAFFGASYGLVMYVVVPLVYRSV